MKILDERAGGDVTDLPRVSISKSLRNLETKSIHVLMAITGVGEKKALKLLNRFRSLRNVFNASESELRELLEINWQDASKMFWTMI
ncbi:MAG: hypothetical protein QXW74_00630 [Archaeoglobaceae archaeon]